MKPLLWRNIKEGYTALTTQRKKTFLSFSWVEMVTLIGTKTWENFDAGADAYADFFIPTGGIWLYLEDIFYLSSQW